MLCKYSRKVWVQDVQAMLMDWDILVKYGVISPKHMEKLGWYDRKKYLKECEKHHFYGNPPSCASPKQTKAYWLYKNRYLKEYTVPCGHCEICKVERSKEWAVKAWCEQQMWSNSCFITLTYDNEHLPEDRKLKRSDIQKFWKDLRYHLYKNTKKASQIDLKPEREAMEELYTNEEIQFNEDIGMIPKHKNKTPLRYLNCGEYGPKTKRPHYHAQIWNFIPQDLRKWKQDERGYWLYNSKKLSQIWGKGWVVIEEANNKTAGYVARYCTKKYKRSDEEQARMKQKHQQEFIGASSLGFIGWTYWEKYKEMIKRNKGILMKENDHTTLKKLPKIMKKKWEAEDPINYEEYQIEQECIGKENWEKLLKNTSLTEEEYINENYRKKMRQYTLLKRTKGDLQGYN